MCVNGLPAVVAVVGEGLAGAGVAGLGLGVSFLITIDSSTGSFGVAGVVFLTTVCGFVAAGVVVAVLTGCLLGAGCFTVSSSLIITTRSSSAGLKEGALLFGFTVGSVVGVLCLGKLVASVISTPKDSFVAAGGVFTGGGVSAIFGV